MNSKITNGNNNNNINNNNSSRRNNMTGQGGFTRMLAGIQNTVWFSRHPLKSVMDSLLSTVRGGTAASFSGSTRNMNSYYNPVTTKEVLFALNDWISNWDHYY